MALTPEEQRVLRMIESGLSDTDCFDFSDYDDSFGGIKAGLEDLAAIWEVLESFNHLAQPSIPLKFRSKLPRFSGVYILYRDQDVYYIGQAVDIAVRWKGHNVLDKLALASEMIAMDDLRIGWVEVPRTLLNFVEIYLIGLLRPVLNIAHNTPL